MKVELSLVSTTNLYSNVYKLISRKRIPNSNSDSDVINACMEMLSDNLEVLSTSIGDENLINFIQSKKDVDISDFMSLRYLLAASGIDILYYSVNSTEINEAVLPEGIVEYVALNQPLSNGIVPFSFKFSTEEENLRITSILKKVSDSYKLFNPEVFDVNPINAILSSIESIDKVIGDVPANMTSEVNSILEFTGIKLLAITN